MHFKQQHCASDVEFTCHDLRHSKPHGLVTHRKALFFLNLRYRDVSYFADTFAITLSK